MEVGSVVRAKVIIVESGDEGDTLFARAGDEGEVLAVFDRGTVMVSWPQGVTECDLSELEGPDDAHLSDGRPASAEPQAVPRRNAELVDGDTERDVAAER